jgi:hypothetical protein
MVEAPCVVQGFRGQQQQRRAQSLAAAFAQMVADIRDCGHAGDSVAA